MVSDEKKNLLGFYCLETLNLNKTDLQYVSKDAFLDLSLRILVNYEVHFCCLHKQEIIPFCRSIHNNLRKKVCDFSSCLNLAFSLPYITIIFFCNFVTAATMYHGKRKHCNSAFFYCLCWGMLTSVLLGLFHFENVKMANSDNLLF